ncbi:MAG: ATP-grasp domain-containing protein, partial [Treponema sp.]|nr:ATP-grasp domain-containing protein [Treponema sp.]
MNITFFSTNSLKQSLENQKLSEIPSCIEYWSSFLKDYPQVNLRFVLQLPARFLLENKNCPLGIQLEILEEDASAEKIAEIIASRPLDIAIPVTFWAPPYDWMSLKDSLVASFLSKKGIICACHSEKTSLICYDKKNTRDFLSTNSFNHAKSVFLDFIMFKTEVNHRELSVNVYKEFILEQIKKLSLPLVVKSTSGLSSWGMDVCKSISETLHVLNSKKTNGNRLIEEFLDGYSFGIEIYGSNKKYVFSPLLINSVNQFGLTSPKQNVKLGPVLNDKFRIKDLYRDLSRLASLLNLNGIAQIDLVFHQEKWYIIEINSRLSGMTESCAAAMNLSLPELLIYSSMLGKKELEESPEFKEIHGKIKNNFCL